MKSTSFHGIKSIRLTDVVHFERSETAPEFYIRSMVITMNDGTFESFDLYSNDGYALIPDDRSLIELKEAA